MTIIYVLIKEIYSYLLPCFVLIKGNDLLFLDLGGGPLVLINLGLLHMHALPI